MRNVRHRIGKRLGRRPRPESAPSTPADGTAETGICWVSNTGLEKHPFTFGPAQGNGDPLGAPGALFEKVRAGEQIDPALAPLLLRRRDATSLGIPAARGAAGIPAFFHCGDHWYISRAVVEVLTRFDLGAAQVIGARLLETDGAEIAAEYFWLNPRNARPAFVWEASPAVQAHDAIYGPGQPPRSMASAFAFGDGDVRISGAALTGPDIWVDPLFINTFFVSQGVAEALCMAGVDAPFALRRAEVML